MEQVNLSDHEVVSHEEWVQRRKDLLVREKELLRLKDELAQQRANLPWELVSASYEFDGIDGPCTLGDMFTEANVPNLLVYHLMFDPAWEKACATCSMWLDNLAGLYPHLRPRTNVVAIAKAPTEKLHPFASKKGWPFRVFSSSRNEFGRDYHVDFTANEVSEGALEYNYGRPTQCTQMPGYSVFYKDPQTGDIYHTYSSYARGLEAINGIWGVLDSLPEGRNDKGRNTYWVRHKEEYLQPEQTTATR